MLESHLKAYNRLKINATSGTLIKSHPKSFTKTYHVGSEFNKTLNTDSPMITDSTMGKKRRCVVIQTMILADSWMISEVVWLDDYLESEGVIENT